MALTLTKKGFIDNIGNTSLSSNGGTTGVGRLDLVGSAILYFDFFTGPDQTGDGSKVYLTGIDVSNPASPVLGSTAFVDVAGTTVNSLCIVGSDYRLRGSSGAGFLPAPDGMGDSQPDLSEIVRWSFDISDPLNPFENGTLNLGSFMSNNYLTCPPASEVDVLYNLGFFPSQITEYNGGEFYSGAGSENLPGGGDARKLKAVFPGIIACGVSMNGAGIAGVFDGGTFYPGTSGGGGGKVAINVTGGPHDYAYLASGSTVTIFKLGGGVPSEVAQFTVPTGTAIGLAPNDGQDMMFVIGFVGFPSTPTNTLYIIDHTGALIGSVDLDGLGNANSPSVPVRMWDPATAFVAVGSTDIDVVDISDPTAPVVTQPALISTASGGANGVGVFDIDPSQNLLYTCDNGGFEFAIWSLAPPGPPPSPPLGPYAAVHALSDRLYAGKDHQLAVWDISTPNSPNLLGSTFIPSKPVDMWANMSVLYVIDDTGLFYAINIDAPSRPNIIASSKFDTKGSYLHLFAFSDMVFLSGSSGLLVLNITDFNPKILIQDSTPIGAAAVSGRRIYRGSLSGSQLLNDQMGGQYCQMIVCDTLLVTGEIQAERVYARHGNFKGAVSDHETFQASGGQSSIDGPINLSGRLIIPGQGSPEGKVAAPRGSLFLSDRGLYRKRSGNGVRGWKKVS